MTDRADASGLHGRVPEGATESAEEEQRVEQDLGALLEDTARERDEYLELAKRTKADFENYRKRVSKEAAQAESRGRAALAREILSVADNLDRALENIASDPQADRTVSGEFVTGVKLVRDELQSALARSGVESYEPTGEKFDPDHHEAMLTKPAGPDDDGKVLDVLEKGYRLDGQILRPARVVVGRAEGGE